MSSSYSSVDWVLSHWAHFTVPIHLGLSACILCVFFHTVYVLYYCEHGGMDLMGLKPNP